MLKTNSSSTADNQGIPFVRKPRFGPFQTQAVVVRAGAKVKFKVSKVPGFQLDQEKQILGAFTH
jgi:hypothetical protein